ncbi:HNH endonuclease [Antrihabitans cavernicola]|nr:HNH endonuclease [Spelaeibacter cavernicola]
MANLDGSRSHGGKYDRPVAAILTSDTRLLQAAYLRILSAARAEGIDKEDLPDFLDLEDGGDLWLAGQDELVDSVLESEVERTLRTLIDKRKSEISRAEIQDTERLLLSAARIGQHRFANEVLRNHGHRCVFCGMSGRIAGKRHPRLLTASHIKPWRSSTNRERLDFTNGLTACPTHDVAFDTGLITVGPDLEIRRTPELEFEIQREKPLQHAFGRPPLADRLLILSTSQRPDVNYLSWHRTEIFIDR